MAFQTKYFNVGFEKTPEWLKEYYSRGICRDIYDEEDFVGISVYGNGKNKIAKKGDMVLLTRSGLMVLPKEEADKFKRKEGKSNVKE